MPTKIVLITGGSRGIGAAAALLLARQGWDVAITYRADAVAAQVIVEQCTEFGRRAIAIQADLGVPRDVAQLFQRLDDDFGTLYALVNNAGVVDRKARVDELSIERMQRMFAINTIGLLQACGLAVKRMSTRYGGHGGVIVNVGSVAARIGGPGEYVDYAASKGAVDSITLGLAKEVATEGIRVACVRPGVIDTDIHASGGQPDRAARMAPLVPVGRPGRDVEIASAIAWLISDEATYTTGAILDVSGGR